MLKGTRKLASWVWLGAALPVLAAPASRAAEPAYPTKPINVLVAFSPGGTMDLSTRMLGGRAEKLLGQPFVFSNNGGGASSVATGIVAKQKPDGYNLVACTSTSLVRIPHLRDVPYKLDDIVPVMHFASPETGIVVKADSPWKTLKEFVDYAKKNPGKVTYSTTGVGSPMHLSMEFIAHQEGIRWTHVPYPGSSPALTALLGGHVTAQVGATEWIPFVKDGSVRLLATHGEKRMASFPNVPTLKEAGYDFVNETVFMLGAPKGTPAEIVNRLDAALRKAMNDPEFMQALDKMDLTPTYRNAADTKKYLQEADRRIGKMVEELKLQKEADQKK